jgi:hypothetical protein
MEDVFHAYPISILPSGKIREDAHVRCAVLRHFYYWLGGRFALIGARIQVKNGIIWTKSFDAEIGVTPNIPFRDENDYILVGIARGATNSRYDLVAGSELEVLYPPCSGCKAIDIVYSPFANSEAVNQLLDFRFTCLTSLRTCREPAEFTPGAWRYYRAKNDDRSVASEPTVERLLEETARDSNYIAVVQVIDNEISVQPGRQTGNLVFRIQQSLKNRVPVGLDVHARFPQLGFVAFDKGRSMESVKKGEHLIAFFDVRPDQPEPDSTANGAYDLLRFTPNSMEIVERGISLDGLADVP